MKNLANCDAPLFIFHALAMPSTSHHLIFNFEILAHPTTHRLTWNLWDAFELDSLEVNLDLLRQG